MIRFTSLIMTAAIVGALVVAPTAIASPAVVVDDAIWANGELYGTVVTDTSFNSPPPRSTDVIYSFGMSGLQGQRSVSEAAPGDRDYNGGRWAVKQVVFTALGLAIHDADNDGTVDFELTSEEQVLHHHSLGHLEIFDTNIYFACPLRR